MVDPDDHPPLPARPPLLTPERIAELVVDRLMGVASPEAVAVGRLLISVDPGSVRLARRYEARARSLMEHSEDPIERYLRLTNP